MPWLSALVNVLKVAASIMALIEARRERGAGYALAVNQALLAAADQTKAAKEELENAAAIHSRDNTDSAFDPTFKRD